MYILKYVFVKRFISLQIFLVVILETLRKPMLIEKKIVSKLFEINPKIT